MGRVSSSVNISKKALRMAQQNPKWVQRAMNMAIKRARFEGACLRLSGTPFPKTDTLEIREATREYVETWLVPLLEAVRDGELETAKCLS